MPIESNHSPAELDNLFGFAPDEDSPIPYMKRTRDWYLALGYANPYRWAHYAQVPFRPLSKPLSQCTATIITTAAPSRPDQGLQTPGTAYNAAAKFYSVYSGDPSVDHDLRIDHVAIDFKHCSMEDSGSWFPLPALRRAAAQGRVGALARRFHGVPTHRSQRHTIAAYGPEVLSRCLADGVHVAVLVPNCPVCHQTLSLVARHLEENGIATVIMGCAKDIVEHAGVPRFLFSDFPLGNAAGRPKDPKSQAFTLELALRVLESAPGPRTTVQSPLRWSESHEWKLDYSNVERVGPEELARRRAEFDKAKEAAKAIRASTA
jgi:D-proline reductase (dithiol) PrdB